MNVQNECYNLYTTSQLLSNVFKLDFGVDKILAFKAPREPRFVHEMQDTMTASSWQCARRCWPVAVPHSGRGLRQRERTRRTTDARAAPSRSAPGMRPLQWNDGVSSERPSTTQLQQGRPVQQQQQQPQPQSQPQAQEPQSQRRQPQLRRGLRTDDFRHPLDRQNTQLLRALPGVEIVAKSIMGEQLAVGVRLHDGMFLLLKWLDNGGEHSGTLPTRERPGSCAARRRSRCMQQEAPLDVLQQTQGMCACASMHARTYTHAHTLTHTHTHAHKNMHTRTHEKHTHTNAQAPWRSRSW